MGKLLSLALTFSLLFSTMQLQIGLHICGGALKSAALFGKAEPCSHAEKRAKKAPSCHHHAPNKEKEDSKGCCNDRDLSLWSINELFASSEVLIEFNTSANWVLPVLDAAKSPLFLASLKNTSYRNYKPPLISQNFILAFQSFLI
jgi:hypothetical protein